MGTWCYVSVWTWGAGVCIRGRVWATGYDDGPDARPWCIGVGVGVAPAAGLMVWVVRPDAAVWTWSTAW